MGARFSESTGGMLKRARTVLFWCHLATGLVVGLVVLIMSVTGVLLTYQRQLTAWVETRSLPREAQPDARPLPLDSLLAGVRGTPTLVTWRAHAPALVEVSMGREVSYRNAYTGQEVGRSHPTLRAFFASVTGWHRWVSGNPAFRQKGRMITGVSNLGFLVLVVSGLFLWLPRNWKPAAVRNVTLFRGGLRGKARDFNWHNVIGLWSWVPLVIVVSSAVVISYTWAGNLVYRAFGESPPGGAARAPAGPPASAQAKNVALPSSIDTLLVRAQQKVPGWKSITLTVPRSDTAPVAFAIDRGTGGEPQKRGTLTLDPATGAERRWLPFGMQSRGQRTRSVLRFAHTGEVLGLFGQTIAGLASLGAVVLVYTGIALSWRRLRSWRRRRNRRRTPTVARTPA